MREKSRYKDVFREYPVGERVWRIYIEYVPEPLPEMYMFMPVIVEGSVTSGERQAAG